jgi:predicted DNA-binding transcriptional regulator AlpA
LNSILLTRVDIAELMKISPATWDRMVASGRTPDPIRISRGCVRWNETEIQQWIAAGCPNRQIWNTMRKAS